MKSQLDIWTEEYDSLRNLPSTNTDIPSRALRDFFDEYNDFNSGRALDAGCGNGRNCIFLAERGFEVTGVEFVHSAIEIARDTAINKRLSDKIFYIEQSLGNKIPEDDNSFDLIIDMMVMHTLRTGERNVYANEVMRLLKPGGYFLFHTIATESPAAQDLINKYSGPELNSYIIPQNGAFEKTFTREELREIFHELREVEFKEKSEFTPAFGDIFERMYYFGLMRK